MQLESDSSGGGVGPNGSPRTSPAISKAQMAAIDEAELEEGELDDEGEGDQGAPSETAPPPLVDDLGGEEATSMEIKDMAPSSEGFFLCCFPSFLCCFPFVFLFNWIRNWSYTCRAL